MRVYERWMRLIKEIPLLTVRRGTDKIIDEYAGLLEWMPSSVSGKYHQHQPLLIDHVEDCMVFAKVLAKGFNLDETDQSILFSAVILHDIGKCGTTTNHEPTGGGKYKAYQDGKYYLMLDVFDHALISQAIIAEFPFQHSVKIGKMAACHGGHWYKHLPQADEDLLEYLMVAIDYLSTKIVVNAEGITW